MTNNVYFEDVQIGQEIPAFERETDFMSWNRYAAVNDEFVYIHMDDEAGAAAGQGAAFGMGNLRWAYVLNALRTARVPKSDLQRLAPAIRHALSRRTRAPATTTPRSRSGQGMQQLVTVVQTCKARVFPSSTPQPHASRNLPSPVNLSTRLLSLSTM